MNLREIPFKKPLKLLALLMTSLLIAGASAAVYYSLSMQPTVRVSTPVVKFVAGDDSGTANATGYSTDGTWVAFYSLKAYPNATLTYGQAINISNTVSSEKLIRLRHGTINNNTGTSNFTSIVFKLIAKNGTQVGGDFTYDNTNSDDVWTPPSAMNYCGIPGDQKWAVKVVTTAASGATAGVTASITIYLDVQE